DEPCSSDQCPAAGRWTFLPDEAGNRSKRRFALDRQAQTSRAAATKLDLSFCGWRELQSLRPARILSSRRLPTSHLEKPALRRQPGLASPGKQTKTKHDHRGWRDKAKRNDAHEGEQEG